MLSTKTFFFFFALLITCSIWVSAKHHRRHHYINKEKKESNNLHFIKQFQHEAMERYDINNEGYTAQAQKKDETSSKRAVETADAKSKADKLAKAIRNINVDEFTATDMFKVKGGLATSVGAVESLVDKIEKKDKMGIAISSISIVSGLASMVGGPIGFVVAMTLDTIKTILSIIDKKQKGAPESESSKLQKVIEKALRKFTETDLNSDWNGYKRLTEVYLKHLEMIDKFDEMKPLPGKDEEKFEFGDMGGLEDVKQQLFDEVTPQIYKVLMSSTHLLGKVEHHISKVCDFDIQVQKVKSRLVSKSMDVVEVDPIPEFDEIKEKDSFATNCLKLYELYAKISSYHYQTYLKSLEAIDKITGEKYFDALEKQPPPTKTKPDAKSSSTKEMKSKRKAYVFMHLLLDMIQSSREYNKKVFKPFLHPYEHYKMRYTVNYYHNNDKMYEHMTTYLKGFFDDKETMKTVPNKVMLCSQQSLLGSCYLEDGTEAQKPGPWRSAYVPKGKSISVEYKDVESVDIVVNKETGVAIKMIGPSSMGMLFTSKMSGTTTDDNKKKWMQKLGTYVKKITLSDEIEPPKVASGTPSSGKKLFRMCVTRDYLQENPKYHASVCITDEFKDKKKVLVLDEIKSPTKWTGKNISLSCDEPNLAFTGTFIPETSKAGGGAEKRWGPFFSPFPMRELPGSTQYTMITVHPYKNDDESQVKPLSSGGQHCNGINNLLCQSETIDKKLFVTICKQPELKGYCEEIPVLESEITGTNKMKKVDLKVINGDGLYDKEGKLKFDGEAKLKTEELPGAIQHVVANQKVEKVSHNNAYNTRKFDKYYHLDNSIWEPMIEKLEGKSKGKKAKNLLQSIKVPDDISVKLYTEFGGSGRIFGPYQGPMTVNRIDGNDVISNVIRSIVITKSVKEISPEDSTTAGDKPQVQPQAEDPNMPNNESPSIGTNESTPLISDTI